MAICPRKVFDPITGHFCRHSEYPFLFTTLLIGLWKVTDLYLEHRTTGDL